MKQLIINGLPVKHLIHIFVKSNGAEIGPPLGTVLGNLGVNSAKFCKDFNDFTKHLPIYFVLKVRIVVFENRSYSFFVKAPSSSFLLNSLKFEKPVKIAHYDRIHAKVLTCVSFNELVQVARFMFQTLPLDKSLSMIWSTATSATISITIN